MKELSIESNLFVPAVAGTGEMLQCTDRHNRIVLENRLMAYPALLPHLQPRDIASGKVLELSLAQCEAGGGLHLRVGQRPFQQAAPTAAYVKDVACTRYRLRLGQLAGTGADPRA